MTDTSTKTHDYTIREWGHDFAIAAVEDEGQTLRAYGWGHGIAVHDYLLLPNGDGTTRYHVSRIRYWPDPPDMWSAVLRFDPRRE